MTPFFEVEVTLNVEICIPVSLYVVLKNSFRPHIVVNFHHTCRLYGYSRPQPSPTHEYKALIQYSSQQNSSNNRHTILVYVVTFLYLPQAPAPLSGGVSILDLLCHI